MVLFAYLLGRFGQAALGWSTAVALGPACWAVLARSHGPPASSVTVRAPAPAWAAAPSQQATRASTGRVKPRRPLFFLVLIFFLLIPCSSKIENKA